MSKKNFLQIFIFLILASCGPGRPYLQTLELNRQGNSAIGEQNFNVASDKYIRAMEYDPFVSQLHLNLGLSFEGLQNADKSLQSYKQAEYLAQRYTEAETYFAALFNQAQLHAKLKKVDEALALYQKALAVIPSSKEVKTNIELLLQQQQGQGDGEGDNKNDDSKGSGQGQSQNQDQDQKKEQQPQQYQQSPKYKPRQFQGKELSEGDVKKILGELKQQESKIRAEYNKKEMKEQPRDKDW